MSGREEKRERRETRDERRETRDEKRREEERRGGEGKMAVEKLKVLLFVLLALTVGSTFLARERIAMLDVGRFCKEVCSTVDLY